MMIRRCCNVYTVDVEVVPARIVDTPDAVSSSNTNYYHIIIMIEGLILE